MMKQLLIPGVAVAGIVAGIAGSNIAANAETATTSTSTAATSAKTQPNGPHQANGKTETALTGSDLEKATAAATAKVSGGTVVRAETDADGEGTYEVHMQTSDGQMTTVFLDSNFAVTSQSSGMGKNFQGQPGGHTTTNSTTN